MIRIFWIISLSFFIFQPVFAQDTLWTLQECIQYAHNNNISVQQSMLTTETNEVAWLQSRGARIPTLTGNATQGFSFGRSIDPFSNQFINQNIQSTNFNLSGSVILFNGFQIQNQIRQNRLYYEAGKYDLATAKNNITLAVAQYYYQILQAQEQVNNARLQIEMSQIQIEKTEKQVRAGSLPEINLIQLQAQLANDRVSLTSAENQVYLAKINLMQVMNYPVADRFSIEVPADSLLTPAPVQGLSSREIYESALTVQPSVKTFRLRKEGSMMGLRAVRGTRYPRLSLNGQIFTGYSSARKLQNVVGYQLIPIGFLQNDPSQMVLSSQRSVTTSDYPFSRQVRDNISESFNFTLSIPILNNRLIQSNIDRANINLRVAELQEANNKIQLRQNIEQAYANMIASEKSYRSSLEAMRLQEQSYLNSERRFQLGMMSPYDFIIQKNTFFQARINNTLSKYQYIYNSKVLEFYQRNQL